MLKVIIFGIEIILNMLYCVVKKKKKELKRKDGEY